MRKVTYLLLTVILATLLAMPVMAQETTVAVPDVVVERIEEYGKIIPTLDHYNTVSMDALLTMIVEGEAITILDVREASEIEEHGTIEGAIHIPMRELGGDNLALLPGQDAKVVVVCAAGFRATIAMTSLHILGYEDSYVLVGGFGAWVNGGMPVVDAPADVEPGAMPDVGAEMLEYVSDYMANLPQGWGGVGSADLALELIDNPPDYLIDVRSAAEVATPGYIEGAQHIWVNEFIQSMDEWPMEHDANIVIYCASGYRGNIAASVLRLMGYSNVRNLAGGINAWIAAEYETVRDFDLAIRLDEYLTNELPAGWGNILPADLSIELMENPPFLLDVRTPGEWDADGYIEGAVLAPVTELMMNLDLLPDDLDAPIVVYCKAGTRGQFAMITLQVLGYSDVRNLSGGITAWAVEGFPVGNTPLADMGFEALGGAGFETLLVDELDIFLTENIPGGWGQVSVEDYAMQSMETEYFLIDVRTQAEWDDDGYIEGATLMTINELGMYFDEIPTDMPIMVYCKAGTRGNFGAIMLQMLGYEAYNLKGGILAWSEAGYEAVNN
jgi:rhodanese-related sulfurtransferase